MFKGSRKVVTCSAPVSSRYEVICKLCKTCLYTVLGAKYYREYPGWRLLLFEFCYVVHKNKVIQQYSYVSLASNDEVSKRVSND